MSYDFVGAVVAGLVALIGVTFAIFQYTKGPSNQLWITSVVYFIEEAGTSPIRS